MEETAPAGYIRSQHAVKVEILAPDDAEHWETVTYMEDRNGYTYTWDVKELKKYEVRIDGATGRAGTGKIVNTQGSELPSTGGEGTV